MAEIKTWQYGDNGETVKDIIDSNFRYLNEQVAPMYHGWQRDFRASDWVKGIISIPYSQYKRDNPRVDVYVKNNGGYSPVYGGYEMKGDRIELQSDIPYEGRVVIR